MRKASSLLAQQATACAEASRLAAAAQQWLCGGAARSASQAELHDGLARLAGERLRALEAHLGSSGGGSKDTEEQDQGIHSASVSQQHRLA